MDGISSPQTQSSSISDDKQKFNAEEMTTIIKETVENTIQDADYSHSKVPAWNSTIVETCLKKLRAVNKNYKFIVTCVIMQKNGAGFYAGSSVYWDNLHDGSASYRHETKSLYAITNVFALSV
ncbi:flagellar inner arm dynein light chain [Halteromyces radiatus]|uniref:flagellar inner arm dynein light chain n=1 Tax=Halteromyces radiatus TaxID=101107 RepID=UPI00221F5CE0|nr:flagellar inner arm dynein light chain [Halteromyces radiatus]KAI8093911.1 flagellar inner arm dynein light chain [Halteromyces radiatus]